MTSPSRDLPAAAFWRFRPDLYAERLTAHYEEPALKWTAARHLRYVADRITRAIVRGNGRVILNMPPNHGKSKFISKWVPTWYLDNLPHLRTIMATHTAELSTNFGRDVRNELQTNPHCMTRLSEDSEAAGRWNTPEGGGMYSVGVGGSLSGWHGDLLILDDPFKDWQQAYSSNYRQRLWEWFNSVFYTRRQPGASIIVLHTRWHPDDLTSQLCTKHPDQWEHICLRAVAEADDPLGRKIGEPLWPERFNAEALKSSAGDAMTWEALYQQRPSSLISGRVYENFTDVNIDDSIDLSPSLPLHLSMDFNINPGMHMLVGQYHEASDLITCVHEIHGPGMSTRIAMDEFDQLLRRLTNTREGRTRFHWPELHVFGDASGSNRTSTTGESNYDIVKGKLDRIGVPYRMRVPGSNPPIIDRVNTFNDGLKDLDDKRHYLVRPTCLRLLADLRTQKKGEDGLPDEHDKSLGHSVAAEGYRVYRVRPIRRQKFEPQQIVFAE